MANFCSECGAPLEENAKFCDSCGKPVILQSNNVPVSVAPHNNTNPSNNVSTQINESMINSNSNDIYIPEDGGKIFFSFEGRINRKRFIIRYLIISAIITAVVYLLGSVGRKLFIILALMPISLVVRRLHDINKSGWWAITYLIPIANLWLVYKVFFVKGSEGRNQYGLDPLTNTKGI